MKSKLQFMMVFAALAVFFGCATTSFAQRKPPTVGGYKAISVEDAGVVAAAEFAVDAYSTKTDVFHELFSIEKAGRQTVAGYNYWLCIEVAIENSYDTQFVQTVVYQDLKRAYRLGAWKVVETCNAK